MSAKIGFIGTGIMGRPMALNILKAGYKVMVYNRTASKAEAVAAAGAGVASSPREVAQWAEILIVMLTGPEAVDAVLAGAEGILAAADPAQTLINMSTVLPAYARRLNQRLDTRRITLIDAPVSGSKKPAEDGTLIILAGGPRQAVADLEPLLLTMGRKVVYCGTAGQGANMKMAVNLLLGIMLEGLCEAVNFGQKCGLATETMLDTILSGPLNCGLFNLKAAMLTSGEFPAQFPYKHMLKDLRFVLQTADDSGAATPAGHTVFQLFRQGLGANLGDLDFAAVKKVLEAQSDPQPGPRAGSV